MKRRSMMILTSAVTALSAVAPAMSVGTVSAKSEPNCSYYVREMYIETHEQQEFDEALFEKYLKYSFLISDTESVSQETMDLCKSIFETERAQLPYVYCWAGRNAVSGGKTERLSLDEESLSRFSDPVPRYYTCFGEAAAVYPDIMYENRATETYTEEYWLDDAGTERLIYTAFNDRYLEYLKFFDAMPEESEIAEKTIPCKDGKTFLYYDKIDISEIKRTDAPVIASTDIWNYEILSDGSAVITGCTLPVRSEAEPLTETMILPSELDGHPVCGIYTALSNTGITKLVIPENYRYVFALTNMKYLEEIEINAPELVLSELTFSGCPALNSVTLNVKNIAGQAFLSCPALTKLDIVNADSICPDAFRNLASLSEVKLPETLGFIGQNAFAGTAVKELTVPENIKGVGVYNIPYSTGVNTFEDPFTSGNVRIADEDCVIKSYYSSEAHMFALKNKCKFSSMDNILFGDTNKDGKLTVADAVVLQKHLLGNGAVGYEGDVNKDGSVNGYDMVSMRKTLVK